MICVSCRWLVSAMDPTLPTTPDDAVLTTTQPDHSVSHARFNASMVMMREMASYIADQPSSMFATYTAALEQFQQKLLDGRVSEVLSALSSMDTTCRSRNGATVVNTSTASRPGPDVVDTERALHQR